MNEFEQSIIISCEPEEVFSLVADVEKMPKYLSAFRRIERQEAGGDRFRVEGRIMGYHFTQDGFFRANNELRRVDFGSDDPALSTGWLRVAQGPDLSASDVTVHLSVQIRPEQEEMIRARFRNLDDMIQDGLKRTLQALKNYCENHGDSLNETDKAMPA